MKVVTVTDSEQFTILAEAETELPQSADLMSKAETVAVLVTAVTGAAELAAEDKA